MRSGGRMAPPAGLLLVILLAAACGDDGGGQPADAPRRDPEAELVRRLEGEGYYDATGETDRQRVARTFPDLCGRLDAEADEAARFTVLVGFLRTSPAISGTGGWPAARVAGHALAALCPAHEPTLVRAAAAVH